MASHNLLVFSDVHLGSDLVHHARPDAPLRTDAADDRDRELAALLDFYREHPGQGRPWRLVIAGDFVDFVGMSVSPPRDSKPIVLDADDRILGLGNAEEHTIYKLRCVARRHGVVFEALAKFVAAGNTLVVVRGNHDVDFHWPLVQDEFIRQLATFAPVRRGQVEFEHWFYYERDRVYVEHGHQYDSYCSHEHLLCPLAPNNPRNSFRSLSDVLLRYIVRPTRGMLETGHDRAGMYHYVTFALRLGIGGAVALARQFAIATVALFRIQRDHFGEGARRLRELHERKMADLAALLDLSVESLKGLASLQAPPVTRSFSRIAMTMMLDRVLLAVLGTFAAAVVLYAVEKPGYKVLLAVLLAAIAAGVIALLQRMRRDIDPSSALRDRATRVTRLMPAAIVVMGHTHLPEVTPAPGGSSTYVNLGSWDGDSNFAGGTRTHLVVHEREDGRSVAELFVWDKAVGPRRFLSMNDSGPVP
jgi:UDP-2,3-diacylglucosamine pyrophosphatase LpxH